MIGALTALGKTLWGGAKAIAGSKLGGGILQGVGAGIGAGAGQYAGNRLFGALGGDKMSGEQGGKSAKAYFDELAPDSTQFERIGSPGAGAGAGMTATAEQSRMNMKVAKLTTDTQRAVADKQVQGQILAAKEQADAYVLSRAWEYADEDEKAAMMKEYVGTERPGMTSAARTQSRTVEQAGEITDENIKGLSEEELFQTVANKVAQMGKKSIADRKASAEELKRMNELLDYSLDKRKWDTVQKWTSWISTILSGITVGGSAVAAYRYRDAFKVIGQRLYKAVKTKNAPAIKKEIRQLEMEFKKKRKK